MTKIQNTKQLDLHCFGHWILVLEIYLGFGAWNLEFNY